ncbi:hypothetical protein UK12_00925 [Saccharothrix sp. ST-888]|nr:hypothetical protein UK12_00925 [Saccharothrix sp. ST-888]
MSTTRPSTTPPLFEARPFSDRCRAVWDRGDHLLIGVSPGNSYFSHRRITELLLWSRQSFDAVDIVYADLHVDAQFTVCGYPAEHALRRADKEVKATRRRVRRGVEESGRSGVGIHALSEFGTAPAYLRLRRAVQDALETDQLLRDAAESMARSFLAARLPGDGAPSSAQLAAGVAYITAELPFFLDTPSLLGVPSSVSCYHAELPLTPVLFGRDEGLRAVAGQAYAVVRPHLGPQTDAA